MLELMNVLDCTIGNSTIPEEVTGLIANIVNLIQIGIPIILVVMGMLDLGKAVASQKEDEIKKAQSMLIKRLVYGALVYLIVFIVGFVIGLVDSEATSCMDAIFNG